MSNASDDLPLPETPEKQINSPEKLGRHRRDCVLLHALYLDLFRRHSLADRIIVVHHRWMECISGATRSLSDLTTEAER